MANVLFDPNTHGRIATDLNDFKKHIAGTNFRHQASAIDASPGIEGATDLQTSLDNLAAFITATGLNGIGYLAVPRDGYNSYTNPTPDFYFNNAIPSLDSFLNPIFSDILSNTPLPEAYARIQNGGVVFIPAGTYYVLNSILLPPGITILGEGYATKIINASNLNLSASPPTVPASPPNTTQPVFIVQTDSNRSTDDAAVDSNTFMFARASRLMNLMVGDNFIEPTLLGDLNYTLPQNTDHTIPLIQQNQGSNFELHGVNLIGRVQFSSGTIVSSSTQMAIGLDTTTPVSTGTYLKITNCMIDGFSLPVNYPTTGGVNDYLEISNSKIRAHGYFNGDGSGNESNCIVSMNDNNARIVSNDLFGNHAACLTIVSVVDQLSAPPTDSLSQILIASNNFLVDRGSSASITPVPYFIDSGIIGTFDSNAKITAYGNVYDSTVGYQVVSGAGSVPFFAADPSATVLDSPTAVEANIGGSTMVSITSGLVHLPNASQFSERNHLNSGDVKMIVVDSSDQVIVGDLSNTGATELQSSTDCILEAGTQTLTLPASGAATMVDSLSNTLNVGSVSIHLATDFTTSSPSPVSSNLTFAMGASESWYFEVQATVVGSDTNGLRVGVLGPGSPTLQAQAFGTTSSTSNVNFGNITSNGGTAFVSLASAGGSPTGFLTFYGTITGDGTTGGTVAIQFVSIASGHTITVKAGAHLTAVRSTGV